MTYHLYGEKFKELRTQKQLPLSYFEEIGMNKGDLSRFEHGKQMIGFERLDVMLQQMNVSLAEYELIINNFVPDFQEAFLNDVDEADFNQDKPKLTKLYEEARETGYGLLAIATKARYDKLEEKEITYVLDFLNKIKEWGYFELSVLYFVLDDLSTLELRKVFRDFETKSHNYYGLPKYSRRILPIVADPNWLKLGKHWYNKVGNVATAIDIASIAAGVGITAKTSSTVIKLIRANRTNITRVVESKIAQMLGRSAAYWIGTAINIGLTVGGTSLGGVIAEGLDRADGRNDGYIFA